MKKIFYTILCVSIFTCTIITPARCSWYDTKWGMSVRNVESIINNKLFMTGSVFGQKDTYIYEDGYKIDIDGVSYDKKFRFYNNMLNGVYLEHEHTGYINSFLYNRYINQKEVDSVKRHFSYIITSLQNKGYIKIKKDSIYTNELGVMMLNSKMGKDDTRVCIMFRYLPNANNMYTVKYLIAYEKNEKDNPYL